MQRLTTLVVLLSLYLCSAASAQQEGQTPERTAAEQQVNERVQHFIDMGMDPKTATILSVLSETGMSPAEIILMTMMSGPGGGGGEGGNGRGDDGGAGLLLFMNAMRNAGSGQPVAIDRGDQLLVLEGGTLYAMDLQKMELTGTIDYVEAARGSDDALWELLVPIINQDAAQQGGSCDQRLRALFGAFASYMGAHDGALPGQEWVGAIAPYLPGSGVLRCPSRPDVAVAYAMNAKLTGALPGEIARPNETILLFETTLNDRSPVGGSEAVPAEGVHDGGVNVLFMDGHVQLLPVTEARNLLDQAIGQ